ncbi:MAG: hypothetical protein ABEI31_03230 [Halodesulfurarchaeum sp.]
MTSLDDRPALRKRKAALDAIPPVDRTETDGSLSITRAFRGQHLEQAIGYLESLGGTRVSEERVEGDGWEATLEAERVPVGPSYRLTEVTITWTGDPEAVEDVVLQFRLKAFRAPG